MAYHPELCIVGTEAGTETADTHAIRPHSSAYLSTDATDFMATDLMLEDCSENLCSSYTAEEGELVVLKYALPSAERLSESSIPDLNMPESLYRPPNA
jgi:hypothetical protein